MKPPALRALFIAGAAGAVLWAWYLLRMEPEEAPRTAGRGPQGTPDFIIPIKPSP